MFESQRLETVPQVFRRLTLFGLSLSDSTHQCVLVSLVLAGTGTDTEARDVLSPSKFDFLHAV